MQKQSVLVSDLTYEKHDTGHGHPEQPARIKAVLNALEKAELNQKFRKVEARECKNEDILRCHTKQYLETVKADLAKGSSSLSTGDTVLSKDSLMVARLAAGGILQAADEVLTGRARNAFCVARPPGHHATPDKGMGFCIFNHIAIAARYAQEKYKVGKVLIVDWDVHHGNGTQDVFYEDETVLGDVHHGNGTQDVFYEDETVFFFSTHQSPWYPGTGSTQETGKGKGLGTILNRPLPAGSGKEAIVESAFAEDLAKAMASYKPELILISAGFDSRINDPLGQFHLADRDFGDLTKIILDMAKEFSDGKVISLLEGGYNLDGLGKAAAAHAEALLAI